MGDNAECRTCGAEMPGDAMEGVCPQCLASSLLDEQSGQPDQAQSELPEYADLLDEEHRHFGGYRLLEEIGRGGMGVVYRARQISLNRIVAMKVIDGRRSPVDRERFRIGAEAIAKLEHPSIVPIYEIGQHGSRHYFTMRFMEAGNLRDAMARERCTPDRAAALIATIARAVHYAHVHGFLHRDIKPDNILLDQDGQAQLCDFGLAKLMTIDQGLTLTHAVMGTYGYMAPEQANGQARLLSTATDVYGLGAVLYEMLAGRPLVPAGTSTEMLRWTMEVDPPPLRPLNPAVDKDLETICLQCLEKDPPRRYNSAAALAEDLDHWRRGEPISAHRSGRIYRVRRWVCRNPLPAGLIALLVLSVIGISILLKQVLDQKRVVRRDLDVATGRGVQRDRIILTVRDELVRRLTDEWRMIQTREVRIHRDQLGILAQKSLREIPSAGALTFVIAAHSNDIGSFDAGLRYASLMVYLEEKLGDDLRRPVRIEFRLFKYNDDARAAFQAGDIDVMRMGAFSLLLAQKSGTKVTPLVKERREGGKWGVIFVAKAPSALRLRDLKSIAVGDETSTTSGFCAPAFLRANGITMESLNQRYLFHDNEGEAIQMVLDGWADAGITGLEKLERCPQYASLRILAKFPGAAAQWVTCGDGHLEDEFAAAFRAVLLKVRDKTILADEAEGFEPVTKEDYPQLEERLPAVNGFFGEDRLESIRRSEERKMRAAQPEQPSRRSP